MSTDNLPPQAPRDARGRHLRISIVVAVGAHLAALGAWCLLPGLPQRAVASAPHRTVAIHKGTLTQAVAQARSQMAARADAARPNTTEPKTHRPAAEDKLDGQVVSLAPSQASETAPDSARYLAESNARAVHESRSRHAAPDFQHVMPEPTARALGAPAAHSTERRRGPGAPGPLEMSPRLAEPGARPAPAFQVPKQAQQDRLSLKLAPSGGTFLNRRDAKAIAGHSDKLHIVAADPRAGDADTAPATPASPGQGGQGGKGLTMDDLVPNLGTLARLPGGPSNDALDDLPLGEGTFLNAREFKYAAFFNRMKAQIAQRWRPMAEYQRRDPTGNIYGAQGRVTVLTVTLDKDGALADVRVAQSSGVTFLDQEGTRALKAAAPFLHPPPGLIDPQGQIVFQFGFHLDVRGGPGLRSPY